MVKKGIIVMVHVDYENIRWRFRDYVEYITIGDVIEAFKSIANDIGELRQIYFYGDWTRRPQDAQEVEKRGCRATNVLSKAHGADRSDATMMFCIDDQSREKTKYTFLIGAGDADYKEVILRCRERGRKVFIACFVQSASRELFTMTEKVYPLEATLNITEKIITALPSLQTMSEETKTTYLIKRLDSIERSLPNVVRSYFINKILLPTKSFGETSNEVDAFVSQEQEKGYLEEFNTSNPKIPGKDVKCLRLKRDNELVVKVLQE